MSLQPFIDLVVRGLVDDPESVVVEPVDRQGVTVYELRVADDDLRLDLFARCDVVELRRPDGSSVADGELLGPGPVVGADEDGAASGSGT